MNSSEASTMVAVHLSVDLKIGHSRQVQVLRCQPIESASVIPSQLSISDQQRLTEM